MLGSRLLIEGMQKKVGCFAASVNAPRGHFQAGDQAQIRNKVLWLILFIEVWPPLDHLFFDLMVLVFICVTKLRGRSTSLRLG